MAPATAPAEHRRRNRGRPTSRKIPRFMAGMTLQTLSSQLQISMRRLSDWENEKGELSENEEASVRALLASARRTDGS